MDGDRETHQAHDSGTCGGLIREPTHVAHPGFSSADAAPSAGRIHSGSLRPLTRISAFPESPVEAQN